VVKEVLDLNKDLTVEMKSLSGDIRDFHRALQKQLKEFDQRLSMLEQKVFGRVN
jgi:hypothetical protein